MKRQNRKIAALFQALDMERKPENPNSWWTPKNVHKLAETSRTFFTHLFFLERSCSYFSWFLCKGTMDPHFASSTTKHWPYGLKGSLPSASVLQFPSPDWSCQELWWNPKRSWNLVYENCPLLNHLGTKQRVMGFLFFSKSKLRTCEDKTLSSWWSETCMPVIKTVLPTSKRPFGNREFFRPIYLLTLRMRFELQKNVFWD